MNTRSLLLGSIAALGLSTAGYAADLGVVTSLDVCDELGLSGLTISSDDTCLVISGSVEFQTVWASNTSGTASTASVGLDFEAVSPTDFGPATAFISLASDLDATGNNGFSDVDIDEAYVSVGDTTVVTAGYTSSLFESTVDVPDGAYDFDFFGAKRLPYNTDENGNVISFNLTHSVGDGFSIGGALETETAWGSDDTVIVGVASYAGSGIAAQGNFAYNIDDATYGVYGAFQGYFDPATIVAAISVDNTGWEGKLGAAVVVDMFTLAGWVATVDSGVNQQYNGKVEAAVTDTVTLNVKGMYDTTGADTWTLSAGADIDITETLTASVEVGTNKAAVSYAQAGLAWEPVADTEFSATGKIDSTNVWTVTLKGSRDFD